MTSTCFDCRHLLWRHTSSLKGIPEEWACRLEIWPRVYTSSPLQLRPTTTLVQLLVLIQMGENCPMMEEIVPNSYASYVYAALMNEISRLREEVP